MAESGAVLDVDNDVQASILLLAAEGGESVMGRTKMQMMVLVLLKNAGSIAGRGCIDADLRGRRSGGGGGGGDDVDRELRRLSDAGAIRCSRLRIEATAEGRAAAVALGEGLDERTVAILRSTKRFYNDMTDAEALAYTRVAYPDAAVWQGALENDETSAEDVLIGLVEKGKITTGHVAMLLHRDRADVMRMVSAAGVPVFQ